MNRFAKFVSVVLVLGVVVSAVPAKAMTTAEMEALIASLTQQIAVLTAQLGGGSSAGSPASYAYTVDLTLGSKGADVTALQQFLVSKGFLTMPAGASYGTFGPFTKAALASFQASAGITPAAGYFGPKTRAYMNSMAVVTPSMPAGYTPSPTGLTGGEGIITVEENGSPAEGVKVYESDVDKGVFGIKVKAQNSDLRVERVKVKIGSAVTAYTKQVSELSIWDGSALLQKIALNSSSVTKEGSDYYVYFSGLNVVVAKDTTKVFTIGVAIPSTVEAGYRGNVTFTIPANGVRTRDAVGLDQYGPGTGFDHTFSIQNALSESAALALSKNGNSPKDSPLVANNQGDVSSPATVLVFDLKSTDGLAKVDQLNVSFTGDAAETIAYLYDGSTLLQSATVSSDSATFTDLEDIMQIPADTTKTYTLKAEYSSATTTASTSIAAIYGLTNNKFLAYNSDGSDIAETGNATSNTMYVSTVAPVISLVSSNISWTDLQNVTTTDTLNGSFTFTVKAEGGDVWIPETGAFDVMLGTSTASASTSGVSISYQEPSGVTDGTSADKIAEGTTVTYVVDVVATAARITTSGSAYYMFFIDNINWDIEDDATPDRDSGYYDDVLKTSTKYAPAQ